MSHELPESLGSNLQSQFAEVEASFVQEEIDPQSRANLNTWVNANAVEQVRSTLSEMK